jgi:hypothetical protein
VVLRLVAYQWLVIYVISSLANFVFAGPVNLLLHLCTSSIEVGLYLLVFRIGRRE